MKLWPLTCRALICLSCASALPEERAALVALYEATGGANWSNSDNWLTDEPIYAWYGVTTDENGRVSRLISN